MIGLGFLLMWTGSGVAHVSWLTLAPGCLLAGVGLGLTNTPVTNVTTASVPSARAGMASGIDMSARMISLAINIALMGFILIAGISSRLSSTLPAALDAGRLQDVAQKIAGGAARASEIPELSLMPAAEAVLQDALIHGFRLMMLYGGLSVWMLALASFLIAGQSRARQHRPQSGNEPCCVPAPPHDQKARKASEVRVSYCWSEYAIRRASPRQYRSHHDKSRLALRRTSPRSGRA